MSLFTPFNFAYWLVVSLVVTLETLTIGLIWRRREAARWTLGYATVFMLGLPLVVAGWWDAATFAALFVAVGLSGAVKVGLDQFIQARRAADYRRHDQRHPDIAAYKRQIGESDEPDRRSG